MAYATYTDVAVRLGTTFDASEISLCNALLDDASVIIDSYNAEADQDKKKLVSCRMVARAMGNASLGVPIGASQGSMSALSYSQSWTMQGGSTGELYLSKLDKSILGSGRIGTHSPLEDLT